MLGCLFYTHNFCPDWQACVRLGVYTQPSLRTVARVDCAPSGCGRTGRTGLVSESVAAPGERIALGRSGG